MNPNENFFEKSQALNSSVIGFEFEFYSDMLKGRAAESLSKLLGKKVTVSEKYHSKLPVDSKNFKLEPDYSGGSKMLELVTGPMEYVEAMPVMIKVLKWIDENGWTTDKCAFQFSVSFDKMRKDVKDPIQNLDVLKFVLGIDENYIYSRFPNRSKNFYAKSVKSVLPRNRYLVLENIKTIDSKMYKTPSDKYYGANFTKIPDGYIEFRYLGGRNYQEKIHQIREVIDYIILYLYNILSRRSAAYTVDDLKKLQSMMDQYKNVVRCFSNPDFFFNRYPDFHVLVDLKGYDENIKSYWNLIKDKIFDLVVEGGVTDCYFNYDTSTGRFQIKDARVRNAVVIDNFDILGCDIKGSYLTKCNIYDSKIRKSNLSECYIVRGTEVSNSKVQDCLIEYTNVLKECFIDCPQKGVNCRIEGGIFRSGILGEFSQVSEKTQKVKGFDEIRKERFVSDMRLKNLNDKYRSPRFGNMNY
jgi:hypothetical protein